MTEPHTKHNDMIMIILHSHSKLNSFKFSKSLNKHKITKTFQNKQKIQT